METSSQSQSVGNLTAAVEDLKQKVLRHQQEAIAYKREGNLGAAKEALLESKRLKIQLESTILELQQQQQLQETQAQAAQQQTPQQQAQQQQKEESSPAAVKDSNQDVDNDDDDDDDVMKDLLQADENEGELTDDIATFSLEEMMDGDMIQEFLTGGLPTPSLDEYVIQMEKCKQLALEYKQKGLTTEALNHLKNMKQLKVVHSILEQFYQNGGILSSGGGLDDQEMTGDTAEERAFLRELMMDETTTTMTTTDDPTNMWGSSDDNDGQGLSGNMMMMLGIDDLLHMDISEIQDAIEIGMQLPPLSRITQAVDHHKAQAVQLKKVGDLEGAKQSLQIFKLWSQQYTQIERLVRQHDGTGNGGVDLEQLLEDEEKPKVTTKKLPTQETAPRVKSSDEWKQDAIRFRDEKRMEEATQALKQYKLALAREEQEKELQARQIRITQLRNEMRMAEIQFSQFIMWERLVDSITGQEQQHAWFRYRDLCNKIINVIETRGTQSVSIKTSPPTTTTTTTTTPETNSPTGILRNLRCLPEDLTELAYQAINPVEERIEVSIVDLIDLHTNKSLIAYNKSSTNSSTSSSSDGSQWVRLEVHVSVQLPSTESETETPIDLRFDSEAFLLSTLLQKEEAELKRLSEEEWKKRGRMELTLRVPNSKVPSSQHYITFDRGNTSFLKTLVRRMERRKIAISVLLQEAENPTTKGKGGWFSGGNNKKKKSDEPPKELASLGKITFETRRLLEDCPCIVGDYPLLGGGKREVGGRLRLCIRTGISFGSSAVAAARMTTTTSSSSIVNTLPVHPQLMFSLNKDPDTDVAK